MTKFISWNVNGLRAAIKHGFLQVFNEMDADFFCIQETKLAPGQLDLDLPGYHQYWNYAEKKGYSGTAIFAKQPPLSVQYDINVPEFDHEGRVITLEYPDFYFVCAYVPNSKEKLARLDFRMKWEDHLRNHLLKLNEKKPVIYTGDLNVAHEEIDIKNPDTNHQNAGFSDEERAKFTELLNAGFKDTFRELYPEKVKYSWWSYRFNARKNNAGWRIDYFVVSNNLMDKVEDSLIYDDIYGSDHCPVGLKVAF